MEEILNTEESNNTGRNKKLPTISEQTSRKRCSSPYGSYKDPDDSSEDEEPDRRIRNNKKKEPDGDPSDSVDYDSTDNEDEYGPDEEDDNKDSDTRVNILDPAQAWTFFVDSCNLTQDDQENLEAIGFESITDMELLGGNVFDCTIITAANITPAKFIRIGIFSKFLYLLGDFRKFPTLPLMARYNNRSKHSQYIDGGYNYVRIGMLNPSSHPLLPIFNNDIENFKDYWATTEGTLWQTHLGRYPDAEPTKPKGKSYNKNKILHWFLYN